ncbi:hypothetical protein TorRG33x02_244870 [Trema orientale]|uniref:Uncharacterized protein n=1 Tax=Trema orientale TaxID=63057 RepID=A0A2P5DQS5_TREOI|nr:hypothetical protein TorRG33x02_244870 [Trema orientale]
MDALSMQEHKSKVPEKMHACGHDAHVVMLFGSAKILKEHENELEQLFFHSNQLRNEVVGLRAC